MGSARQLTVCHEVGRMEGGGPVDRAGPSSGAGDKKEGRPAAEIRIATRQVVITFLEEIAGRLASRACCPLYVMDTAYIFYRKVSMYTCGTVAQVSRVSNWVGLQIIKPRCVYGC